MHKPLRTAGSIMGALLLVFGCKPSSPPLQPSHRGLYIGGAANVFTPCGESHLYWVEGSEAAITPLGGSRARLTGAVPRPVYIEVQGKVLPRGGQAEYDGILQIDTVLAVKARRPRDCGLPKAEPEEP